MKISKIVVTSCHILKLKCTKFKRKRPTSTGREGREREERRRKRGKGGKGERGGEGKGSPWCAPNH